MVVVLILASGAAWESAALGLLEREPGVVVLRRCVDVPDLLAAASAGQADVAVVALEAPGLDLAAIDHLRRFEVRPLAIVPGRPLRPAPAARRPTRRRGDRRRRPARRAARGGAVRRRVRRHRRPRPARSRARRLRREAAASWRCGDRPGRQGGRPSRWPSRPSSRLGAGVRRWSTPIPTAAPSPSSWASSTRSPDCSRRRGWQAAVPSRRGSAPCSERWAST